MFPGAADLFTELDSAISLAFLSRFTTQAQADWLTPKRLGDWLAKQGYSGRTDPLVMHAKITDAARGITGPDADTLAGITRAFLATLTTLVAQIKTLSTRSTTSSPRTPTPTSSPACPDPAASVQHACWARSATAEPGSPSPKLWPASP